MYPTRTTFTTGTCRLPAVPPAATLAEPVAVYRGTWAPPPTTPPPTTQPTLAGHPADPARALPTAPAGHPAPGAQPARAALAWPATPAPAAQPAEPARTPQPAPAGHPAGPAGPEAPSGHPAPGVEPARAAAPGPAAAAWPATPAPAAQPAPAAPAHPAEPARARTPQSDPAGHPVPGAEPALAVVPGLRAEPLASVRPAAQPVPAWPAGQAAPQLGAWAAPAPAGYSVPGAEPARAAATEPAVPARAAATEPAVPARPVVQPAESARMPQPAPVGPAPEVAAWTSAAPAPARPAAPGTRTGPVEAAPAATQPFGATRFGSGVAAAHPVGPEPAVPGPAAEHARGDVPAARGQGGDGGGAGIPHPTPEPPSGVPGPGPAEIAARAVARGMRTEDPGPRDGLPRPPRGSGTGTAVTQVPLHLPFRPQPHAPASPAAAPVARAPRKPPAGRRVPRGDDRLREHRGPVLPGWIAVLVGGFALLGCAAVLWRAGVVPAAVVAAFGATPRAYQGLRAAHWPPLAFLGIVTLLALGGLGRAKAGHAWVLTLFGRYRGTVRRTGLTWISPLLLRQRVDVRLRHWRSEPMAAVDSGGLALQVVVQVVWQVKDTARATLAVEDHIDYLAEQVESAMARVLSQLPADAFHEDAPTLRDAEAVGDALTRMVAAETEAVGIEVFSAQPTRIEYAPEVAEAMRRRRVAAIDAKHRDTVLTSVVDAVDDTVHRLTSRGIVELDDYERKALVKDLTVAFYTGRSDQ
ncbi:SPFH domain-containing protein [Streptomyces racemochromogenes]